MQFYLKKQLYIATIIYTGQLTVGFSLGWSAPVIPVLQDPDQTILPAPVTNGEASLIGSVLYIGAIIGPYVASYFSNNLGRRPSFFIAAGVGIASFLLLALAKNVAMLLAGRICTGLGAGMIAVMNLVYLGEIASTNIRGMLLTGTGIFSTLGTLLVYSVAPYVPYMAVNSIGIGLLVIYIVGLFTVPESPVFYMLRERNEEAKTTLINLGRENEIDILLRSEKELIKEEKQGEWKDLFLIKCNRKAFIITLVLNAFQQLSGVVAVIFFATTIFEMAGSSIRPNLATIIIGITQLVASCIAPSFVERSGRRILLLLSTAFCFVSLAILGTYFYLDFINNSAVEHLKWLPLLSLIVFFLSYDFGFGIIPNTLVGEMFQPSVRGLGSALTAIVPYMVGFGVSTGFGYLITSVGGHIPFWIFSGACAVAFIFTAVYVPETKGKTFAEIQEILSK